MTTEHNQHTEHTTHDSSEHGVVTPANSNTSSNTPWIISTFLLLGMIIGFSVSQVPYVKNLSANMFGTAPQVLLPTNGGQQAAPAPKKAPILTEAQIKALPDDDIAFGDPTAPVTIVEFSDFQCPFCGSFAADTLPSIEEQYIKTGKVRLIYRDYPLSIHPQAIAAAHAAECADEQDKFREMHDKLFSGQGEWAGNPKALEVFEKYAKAIGVKVTAYKTCMDEKKYLSEIQKDMVDGTAVGVSATPAFFINGKFVEGALPFDAYFKPILEAELAGKKWEVIEDPVTNRTTLNIEK